MSEFASFSQLPIELRLQIWTLALPEPRVIHITNRHGPEISKYHEESRSRHEPSPLLETCHESRMVFNALYKKLRDQGDRQLRMVTYIDPARDILFLDAHVGYASLRDDSIYEMISKEMLASIRNLAVDSFVWNWSRSDLIERITALLQLFPFLKELIFAIGETYWCHATKHSRSPLLIRDPRRGMHRWVAESAQLREDRDFKNFQRAHPDIDLPKLRVQFKSRECECRSVTE